MKYFIRKRKDCISSFFACRRGGGEMEAGHKEKRYFFWKTTTCVWWMEGKCEDWVFRGKKGGGKKMSKTSTLCRKLWKRKFDEVKLSLLEIWNVTSWVDIRAISNVVFFAPLSIGLILRIFISVWEKFRFSNNEIPFLGVGVGVKKI